MENSGLVNIREQINKLSTDLNITRKGLEVFSGERKLTVPSNAEIEFGIEFKKQMKQIKVIVQFLLHKLLVLIILHIGQ